MESISSIEMFNILKVKLGEKEAKALTEQVESRVEKSLEKEKNRLATKEDILEIKIELKEQKSEIIKWMFIFWIGQIVVTLGIIYYRG